MLVWLTISVCGKFVKVFLGFMLRVHTLMRAHPVQSEQWAMGTHLQLHLSSLSWMQTLSWYRTQHTQNLYNTNRTSEKNTRIIYKPFLVTTAAPRKSSKFAGLVLLKSFLLLVCVCPRRYWHHLLLCRPESKPPGLPWRDPGTEPWHGHGVLELWRLACLLAGTPTHPLVAGCVIQRKGGEEGRSLS